MRWIRGSRTLLCSPREARLGLEGLEGLERLEALEGLEELEGGGRGMNER